MSYLGANFEIRLSYTWAQLILSSLGQLSKYNLRKIAIIFLSFSLNMRFGCSKTSISLRRFF